MAGDINKIKLLILDVDGVLTTGHVIFDDDGREIKVFHAKDGAGIKYWHRAGHSSAIITGRPGSGGLKRRCEELDIVDVYQNVKEKIPSFEALLKKHNLSPHEAAYIGDDLTDMPVMRRVGFSAAVSNAVSEVRELADFVSELPGGEGAVREIIEHILKEQNLWDGILARYQK